MTMEPLGTRKNGAQMRFEPTTLRDIVGSSRDVDHGGSWVQIPSGARIFPSSQWFPLSFSHSLSWVVGWPHLRYALR